MRSQDSTRSAVVSCETLEGRTLMSAAVPTAVAPDIVGTAVDAYTYVTSTGGVDPSSDSLRPTVLAGRVFDVQKV